MLTMAETASDTITIEASPDAVWAIATDIERYPEWARDVKDVVVTARDPSPYVAWLRRIERAGCRVVVVACGPDGIADAGRARTVGLAARSAR